MQIEWSSRALNDLSEILRYVIINFGTTVAYRVNNEINNEVDSIAQFPEIGRIYFHDKKSNITYRSLTSRFHNVIYTSKDNTIYIITLWNTRHNTKRLTYLLKHL